MTDETMRLAEQTTRPMRLLPHRLTTRLNERHMPATPTLKRLVDELQRPARRRGLRKRLAASRQSLLPGLTVLVPVRDRAGVRLANLLASLARQSARDRMRIVVIDYGSGEDEEAEIAGLAAAEGADLVRIEADEWNRSAALNAGLRRVLTRFVLVADADLIFEPSYVEKALRLLEHDPLRIVVSAMRDLPDMAPEAVSTASFAELSGQASSRYDAKYHPSIVAVHRMAIAAAGGYDEGYRSWGVEDVDLFTRLRHAGLDPVDAGRETYLHQWHPKYHGLAQGNLPAIIDANKLRFDGKRSVREHGQRKAIVTAAGPRMWRLLERYALPTFWRFADRFAYDVLPSFLDDDGQSDDRHATNAARWAKLLLLREAVKDYDIVVWLDADVMICRFDDDIAFHLAPEKFQAFALEQVPQDQRINPNTGVWVMRGGRQAGRFLRAIEKAGQQRGPWADQATVMKVLGWHRGGQIYHGAGPGAGSRFLHGTGWLPPSWNQLYAVPGEDVTSVHAVPRVPEPYALHFAGMSIDEREPVMRRTLEWVMATTAAVASASLRPEMEPL
jgi:glycosyltransferase involved in cell wall biosynthesis